MHTLKILLLAQPHYLSKQTLKRSSEGLGKQKSNCVIRLLEAMGDACQVPCVQEVVTVFGNKGYDL